MSQASLNSELEEIHHDKGDLSTIDTSQSPNLETFNQAREKSPIITNGLLFGNIIESNATKTRMTPPTVATKVVPLPSKIKNGGNSSTPNSFRRCVCPSCPLFLQIISGSAMSTINDSLRKEFIKHIHLSHSVEEIKKVTVDDPDFMKNVYGVTLCLSCNQWKRINNDGSTRGHKCPSKVNKSPVASNSQGSSSTAQQIKDSCPLMPFSAAKHSTITHYTPKCCDTTPQSNTVSHQYTSPQSPITLTPNGEDKLPLFTNSISMSSPKLIDFSSNASILPNLPSTTNSTSNVSPSQPNLLHYTEINTACKIPAVPSYDDSRSLFNNSPSHLQSSTLADQLCNTTALNTSPADINHDILQQNLKGKKPPNNNSSTKSSANNKDTNLRLPKSNLQSTNRQLNSSTTSATVSSPSQHLSQSSTNNMQPLLNNNNDNLPKSLSPKLNIIFPRKDKVSSFTSTNTSTSLDSTTPVDTQTNNTPLNTGPSINTVIDNPHSITLNTVSNNLLSTNTLSNDTILNASSIPLDTVIINNTPLDKITLINGIPHLNTTTSISTETGNTPSNVTTPINITPLNTSTPFNTATNDFPLNSTTVPFNIQPSSSINTALNVLPKIPIGPTVFPILDPRRFSAYQQINIQQWIINFMFEVHAIPNSTILSTKALTTKYIARGNQRNEEGVIRIYDLLFQALLSISDVLLPLDDILKAIWLVPRILLQTQQMYPGSNATPMSLATRISLLTDGYARILVYAAFDDIIPINKVPDFSAASVNERKTRKAASIHKALQDVQPGVAASIAMSKATPVLLPLTSAEKYVNKMFHQPVDFRSLNYPASFIDGQLQLTDFSKEVPLITDTSVNNYINALKPGVSPGNSGCRDEYLVAIWRKGKKSTQEAIILILSLIVQNKLPKSITPLFVSTIMTTITKPANGLPTSTITFDADGLPNNLRPLQCIDSYFKMAEATLLQSMTDDFRRLAKHNECYGLGTKGGTEIVVHQVQIMYREAIDYYILADDARNFYGLIPHQAIIDACVVMKFEKLIPLFMAMYNDPSLLFTIVKTDDGRLMAVNNQVNGGGFQGSTFMCMIANIMMAFIHHETHKAMSIRYPNIDLDTIVFPSYIDDTYLMAPYQHLILVHSVWLQVLSTIMQSSEPLNYSKSLLLPGAKAPPVTPQYLQDLNISYGPKGSVQVVEALKVCGGIVGKGEAYKALMQSKVDKINEVPIALTDIATSLQDRYLTVSFTPGRQTYLMRTTPPAQAVSYMRQVDHQSIAFITELLGLSPQEVNQITLTKAFASRKEAGLGFVQAADLSLFAYLASVAQSICTLQTYLVNKPRSILSIILSQFIQKVNNLLLLKDTNLDRPISQWVPAQSDQLIPLEYQIAKAIHDVELLHLKINGQLKHDEAKIVWSFNHFIQHPEKLQKFTTSLYKQAVLMEMETKLTAVQKADNLSIKQEGANEVLKAFPTERALTLPNAQFQIILRQRVLIDNPGRLADTDRCLHCNAYVDSPSIHAPICKSGGHDKARHNLIVEEFKSMIRDSGLFVSREEPRPVGLSNKRADVKFYTDDNNIAHLDIHVVSANRFQRINDQKTHEVPLAAAHAGFLKKNNHHLAEHDRAGIKFTPMIFETAGGMHAAVIDFIKYCAQVYAAHNPDSVRSYVNHFCPNFKRYWLLRLSIANLFGTANAILSYKRLPKVPVFHQSSQVNSPYNHAQPFRQYVRRPIRR